MTGFHNPYHFVPALPRDPASALGDRTPTGHDRLHADRWTGRLAVTLTTVTPLLIPDEGVTDAKGHRTFGTRVADGRVYLPPTTVKGALRSAYEAVTNSRMGVFSHPDPLGYRPDARSGLDTEPVLIRLGADGAPVAATGCLWLNHDNDHKMIKPIAVPSYDPGSAPRRRYPDGTEPRHGDKVSAWVELIDHDRYRYWRVVTIWRSEADPDQPRPAELGARSSGRHAPMGPAALVRGFLHRTNANIKGKHDERLFPVECVQHDPGVTVQPRRKLSLGDVWDDYRRLIADYRAQHVTERRDDIWGRRKPNGAKATPSEVYQGVDRTVYAWSRHLYDTDGQGEGPDPLRADGWVTCYARCSGDTITELRPVLISRRLHESSPDRLLPVGVEPAEALDQLSPADRVFGWVRQTRRDDAEEEREGAWRGALRVGPVHGPLAGQALEELGEGIPLEILSAPKPSQGRFYTGVKGPGDVPKPLARDAAKESFFASDRVIRGRKVYPHRRGAESPKHWDPRRPGQEFRRPGGTRDDQNRTVTSWVRIGQEFTCAIDVRNLSDLELGALLWLLDPSRFGTHRMGGGKPLGFGSVRLRLAESGHDLRLGQDWAADFTSLGGDPVPDETGWRGLAERFESVVSATPGGRAVLDAVRAVGTGFAADHPVHYPRLGERKDPNGENYRWFVENERTRQIHGRGSKRKDAESLPPFGQPLPYDTRPPQPLRDGGHRQDRRRT